MERESRAAPAGRVCVIGASGFLGMNLVEALQGQGVSMRATRRRSGGSMLLRRFGVEVVEARLEDAESLRRAMDGCASVYLLAGYYPRYSIDREAAVAEGVAGVRAACEAARAAGVERLIYTSSVATLAPAPPGRAADERDELAEMPADSVYRAAKWAMERELADHAAKGLGTVTLLPGGCLGPWDVRVGTGGFLVGTVRGALPYWLEGTVNMVDVADVATAHVAALSAPLGSRYCVSGHDVRVGWLLQTVVERYGGKLPEQVDVEEARRRSDADERAAAATGSRVPLPREIVDLVTCGQPVSSARAERELGVRFRPLLESLDRAHGWFVRCRLVPPLQREDPGCSRPTENETAGA